MLGDIVGANAGKYSSTMVRKWDINKMTGTSRVTI
jgi:hypothetical protein